MRVLGVAAVAAGLVVAAVTGALGQRPFGETPIEAGAMAPDFTLESSAGAKVSLRELRGDRNLVLVFYRSYS